MARFDRIVDILSLKGKLDSMPNQLSGGQQQRVAIARRRLPSPPLCLVDVSTGNLDSRTSADMLGAFENDQRGIDQTVGMMTRITDRPAFPLIVRMKTVNRRKAGGVGMLKNLNAGIIRRLAANGLEIG